MRLLMRLMRCLTALAVLTPLSLSAQETSYQARQIFHPTVDLSKHWFATGWVIGNERTKVPNNFNLFGGMGYRKVDEKGKDEWTLEMLYQKQFTAKGGASFLNFRFTKPLPRKLSLYAEAGPSLSRKALTTAAFVERQITKRCKVGGETDNTVFRQGRDSWGGGPSASCLLVTAKDGDTKLVTRFNYQFRPNEPNVFRWYLILHTRFRWNPFK